MKNKIVFAAIILAVTLGFFACKKDRTTVFVNNKPNNSTPASKFSTMSSFYKTLRPQTQSFQVDAVAGGTVRGDKGMTFQFAPNSFRTYSGAAVTGKVNISLIEVTRYAEMMGTSARTEAFNGVLGSAAMFNIIATQNGQPLLTSNVIKTSIPVNKDADLTNIKKFEGIIVPDTAQDTTIKWDTDSIPFKFNADSLKQVYDSLMKIWEEKRIVKFDLYIFGWCNLDMYYNSPTGCPIRVTYTGITNLLSAEVYMKLNQSNLKGLYRLSYDQTKDEFNSTYFNLPPGWNIHIIVLLKDKNKKVYKEDRIITNAVTVHNFSNLKEISDDDLEAFFKGLN
jgi:hypothetical protein